MKSVSELFWATLEKKKKFFWGVGVEVGAFWLLPCVVVVDVVVIADVVDVVVVGGGVGVSGFGTRFITAVGFVAFNLFLF